MSEIVNRVKALLDTAEELVALKLSQSYSVRWLGKSKDEFIFTVQTPMGEKVYTYQVDVGRSFHLGPGEAKSFVACTLILKLEELLKSFTKDLRKRDSRVKEGLREYRSILQPALQKQGSAESPRTVLTPIQYQQLASLIASKLVDKGLQTRLYARGLCLPQKKKSPQSQSARLALGKNKK